MSSSDLETARAISERLRSPEGNTGPVGTTSGYVRFRAAVTGAQLATVAAAPAPAPGEPELPPAPRAEDLPAFGAGGFEALLEWCLGATGAESAFIVDEHGLPVADRGTLQARELEEFGARLAVIFDQASRLRAGTPGAVTIEFGERRLSGISVDFGANQFLRVGILGPRETSPAVRRIVVESLQRWMGAE